MIEKMVGSTSSYSNMHGIVDDNSNPYRNIVMDVIRINQGHADQCPVINEKLNLNVTRFFFIF
jgi:hypothetical protein